MISSLLYSRVQVLTIALVTLGLAVLLGAYGSGVIAIAGFYSALIITAVLVSYVLAVLPYASTSTYILDGEVETMPHIDRVTANAHPGVFVEKVQIDERPMAVFRDPLVPVNLPVGFGADQSVVEEMVEDVRDDADLARALETQAHLARVLLSTDAIQSFIASIPVGTSPQTLMTSVLMRAKAQYPSEDGWVVLSAARMNDVCLECMAAPVVTDTTPFVPTLVPEGSGSLAEMIALGNLSAAFSLIGHRPMFALADAVADFDALYRIRHGEEANISALLLDNTATMSDETLKGITVALTSALDGTYTNEFEAVKTAIMKAIRVRG